MKKIFRVLSVFMAAVILFSVCAYAGSAFPFNEQERAETASQWEAIQSDDTIIALSVGDKAGEIGFSWLSGIFDRSPSLKISSESDMSQSIDVPVESKLTLVLKRSNKASVTGLEEGKTYYYTYTENGVVSEVQSFKIQKSDEFSVIFVSDSQIGRSGDTYDEDVLINDTCGWNKTVKTAINRYPDTAFIVSAGDQTEYGFSLMQYKAFLSPTQLRNYPLATAIGNHDFYFPCYTYYSNHPNTVKEKLASPAGYGYYFSYGDVLFIVINSNDMYAPDQSRLLAEAVKAYPNATRRVAVLHHSPYSAVNNDSDFCLARGVFAPLFDAYDIDLVLSGNDHMYASSYPVESGEIKEGGTVYVQASSASGSNFSTPDETDLSYLRFILREKTATYTALNFTSDNIEIITYRTDTDEVIDTLNIPTAQKSEKNDNAVFFGWALSFVKTVVSMFK